jgi:hypothetical protein
MPRSRPPLTVETSSPLNAPPVRLGLQTKLNLLAIGLIVRTAVVVSNAPNVQQRTNGAGSGAGSLTAAMLAEVADDAITSADVSSVVPVLDQLATNPEVAYVVVLDTRQRVLLSRSYGDAPVPKTPLKLPTGNEATDAERKTAGGTYRRSLFRAHRRDWSRRRRANRPRVGYIELG